MRGSGGGLVTFVAFLTFPAIATPLGGGPRPVTKIEAQVGQDVQFGCPSSLKTTHQVEWYKENPNGRGRKRITQFPSRYELTTEGVLKIHSLTPEDGGIYACRVGNEAGVHLTKVLVTGFSALKYNYLKFSTPTQEGPTAGEYSEPQINKDLLPPDKKAFQVAKGSPVIVLKCESSGSPVPTITWYKNGQVLTSSTRSSSTLKIFNVSHADTADYKCQAVNLFGLSTYQVTLKVMDFAYGAAEILDLYPKSVRVQEGEMVRLSCTAKFEGVLSPYFAWVRQLPHNKTDNYSDGKVFFHPGTAAYYTVLKTATITEKGRQGTHTTELHISHATKKDEGLYFCLVAGLQGFNRSESRVMVEARGVPPPPLTKWVSAPWAVAWTISFLFLVMLVLFCFAQLYCRPRAPVASLTSCKLPPESSPLTLSTQESFLPPTPPPHFYSTTASSYYYSTDCESCSQHNNSLSSEYMYETYYN